MLAQFSNLGLFDSNKSEKYQSIIFSSHSIESNEPPMYNKLIRYYLFMYVDIENAIIAFANFKKYFDRLLIDESAIEENRLIEYYLPNICKGLKKATIENFDDMNKSFKAFDNELFGKRHGTITEKLKWLFDKYVLIALFIAIILIISYRSFSNIANWVTSHETLANGIIVIIGAIIGSLITVVLSRK